MPVQLESSLGCLFTGGTGGYIFPNIRTWMRVDMNSQTSKPKPQEVPYRQTATVIYEDQRRHSRPGDSTDQFRRDSSWYRRNITGNGDGRGSRPGSRGGRAGSQTPGLPYHGLRQIPLRQREESQGGAKKGAGRADEDSADQELPTSASTIWSTAWVIFANSLVKGNLVKISMRFLGRQVAYRDRGRQVMQEVADKAP